MPVFVDPRTGERFENVPEDEQERARAEFGLLPLEQYEEQQAYEALPLGEKAIDTATAGLQGIARGAMAPGIAIQRAITGSTPNLGARPPDSALSESVFSPPAAKRAERHPIAAGIGESVPTAIAGAALGAGATGLRAATAALGAESLLGGAGQEAVEATVQDRDFSAESALANGAAQFLIGAVTSGATAALARPRKLGRNLLAEAEHTASTEAARRGVREAEQVASGLPSREARSVGAAGAADAADDFTAAYREVDGGQLKPRQLQAVAEAAPSKRGLMALDTADSMDKANEILQSDLRYKTKLQDFETIAEDFTPQQIEAQRAWVSEKAAQGRAIAETLENSLERIGHDSKGFGRDVADKLRHGWDRIQGAENAAQRNIEVDLLKRTLDDSIKRLPRMKTIETAHEKLLSLLRPYSDELRNGLVDASLWGRNAELQRATNKAWEKLIDPWKRVQDRLSVVLGREWGEAGAAAVKLRADSKKIEALLASKEGREFYDDMTAALEGLEDMANARAEFGVHKLDRIDELRSNLENIRDQFNTAGVLRVAERKAGVPTTLSTGEVLKDVGAGVLQIAVPGAGTAIQAGRVIQQAARALRPPKPVSLDVLKGTATGRIFERNLKRFATTRAKELADIGEVAERLPSNALREALRKAGATVAAAGGVYAALAPGEAGAVELQGPEGSDVRVVQALNNVARSTSARVADAVVQLFAPQAPKGRKVPSQTKALQRRASKLGFSTTLTRFLGKKHDDPEAAFEQKRKTLMALAGKPELLAERMAANWGDLPEQQPEVFAKMTMQAARIVDDLIAHMPVSAGRTLLNPDGFPPTIEELEEFAARWQGDVEPLSVVDDLAMGDAPDEALEAVRDNWPALFRQFQGSAMAQLNELRDSRRELDREQLEYLDRVLDLGGAGEPMLSWSMALLVDEAERREGGGQEQEQPAARPQRPVQTAMPERRTPQFAAVRNQ